MDNINTDIDFMSLALEEAAVAFAEDEVPIGAVLALDNGVIVRAHNKREGLKDPTAHAEVIALREGARIAESWRLNNAALYVTKEPCVMCAGAMINARLGSLIYGCRDIKGGAVDSLYNLLTDRRLNHQVKVRAGVLEEECAALLKRFFENRR